MQQNRAILVDADSLHSRLRAILLNLARRTEIPMIFVSTVPIKEVTAYKNTGCQVRTEIVKAGLNSADNWMVNKAKELLSISNENHPNILSITHDKPLSWRMAELGITSLDERGNLTLPCPVRSSKTVQDAMRTLKMEGNYAPPQKPLSTKDIERFSNALNKWILG